MFDVVCAMHELQTRRWTGSSTEPYQLGILSQVDTSSKLMMAGAIITQMKF